MKKILLASLVAVLAVSMLGQPASAVPVFKKKFDSMYVEKSKDAGFQEAAKTAKCNLCHFGKKKANRNDYGMALSKLLKKDDFKTSRVKAEPEKVDKEMEEAFKKVEAMKSSGGKTFGELIKAGELPGTAPAE